MADTALLIARMEVSLRGMEKQLARAGGMADKSVRDIEKRFQSANLSLPGNFMKGVATALAAVSFEQLIRGGREAIATLADLDDASTRTGASAEFIQKLEYAVRLAGGAAGDATEGITKFARVVSEAGQGTTDFSRLLEANGVALRDAGGGLRSIEQLLPEVANLIQNAANPMDQLNIATEAFGRSGGPAMVNALKDGAEGLKAAGDEASRLGGIISDEVVKSAAELDDDFTRLEIVAGAWAKTAAVAIGEYLLPAIERVTLGLRTLIALVDTPVADFVNNGFEKTYNSIIGRGNATIRPDAFGGLDADEGSSGRMRVDITGGRRTVIPSKGGAGRGGGGRSAESVARSAERARDVADLENVRRATELARFEQERYNQAMDDMREVASAGLGTLVDGLMEGKDAAELLNDVLNDVLKSLANLAQQMLLNGLFGGGSAGAGGLLSGLFGGAGPRTGTSNLFQHGGITRGPSIAGEAGPEAVVPLPDGRRIPVALQGGGGGGVQVVVNEAPGSRVASRREEGGPNMKRIVLDIVNDHIASGGADGAMQGRYGARPRKVR